MDKVKPCIVSHISLSPDAIQTFLQRQEVQQAFPYLSPFRRTHLKTVAIHSRSNELHEYFVLQQGRKRFLFDTVESQVPSTDISDDRHRKSLSLTLVVPHKVMRENGYITHDNEGHRRFQNRRDARRFFAITEREGYFTVRGTTDNPKGIENNTDFIQPIPAVVIQDAQDNILFTVRGGKEANHDERLAGVIATPYTMGHSEPSDFGLWRRFVRHGLKLAMYRETAEEAALKIGQETFHIFHPRKSGHGYHVTLRGILNLHRYYNIRPLGVVYREDTPIDAVHAGVIFLATPKRKDVALVRNDSSREIHHVIPISQQDYHRVISDQKLTPSSWNKPIMHAVYTAKQ